MCFLAESFRSQWLIWCQKLVAYGQELLDRHQVFTSRIIVVLFLTKCFSLSQIKTKILK